MKLPHIARCNISYDDTLTVEHASGDIALFAHSGSDDVNVSLYLTPAKARELRRALKTALKEAEDEA